MHPDGYLDVESTKSMYKRTKGMNKMYLDGCVEDVPRRVLSKTFLSTLSWVILLTKSSNIAKQPSFLLNGESFY